jgi:hypothetical protein
MMLKLNRRIPSVAEQTKTYTDEHVLPKFTAALQESFGPDFNLIRAVREYGPTRMAAINKELLSLLEREKRLTEEMNILTKLIAAATE